MYSISAKRRIRYAFFVFVTLLVLLSFRLAWIQFVMGSELQAMAYRQHTLDRTINPNRGTIYDRNGTILASSATVETVSVNPMIISSDNKEKVAKALSDIFELDYEKTLKKVKKRSSIETIVKKIDKEKADELRVWMEANDITSGINIDEDTKRYYPYNELCSQVIGFCGSDNQGLNGIEAKYDKTLSGEKGKISRASDAKGRALSGTAEEYISAIDGNSIELTIDVTIQSIVEKHLEEACIDNVCTDGGNVVIINPNNGDILAMATYPGYNLNTPYTINSEELASMWSTMSSSDKSNALEKMWRNKAISDTYEPGSTFKLITASAALEEGLVTDIEQQSFACTGGIDIAGTYIKCWRYYRPHGSESLRMALMNSCNPIFIGLGQKIGVEKYFSYLEKFGLLSKTGIDLSGEANSIFIAKDKAGPVELATISFGQRFEITPLQLVRAVSSIVNGGKLLQPRVVKAVINSQTGEKQEFEPIVLAKNVVSKETSQKVLSMMESVVASGTGKNAQVLGYTVGGKTGTSEDGVNTGKYVTSFCGVASISDPEVVILITLYNPTGEGGHQGGGVAAPIGSQILSEVLPYLELKKDNTETLEETFSVTVPNITGMSVKDATKTLSDLGLSLTYDNQDLEIDKSNTFITEQTPKEGISINSGNSVYCKVQ